MKINNIIKNFITIAILDNLDYLKIIFENTSKNSSSTMNNAYKCFFECSKLSYLKDVKTTNAKIVLDNVDYKSPSDLSKAIKYFSEADTIEFIGSAFMGSKDEEIELEEINIKHIVFRECEFVGKKTIEKVLIASGLAEKLTMITFEKLKGDSNDVKILMKDYETDTGKHNYEILDS